MNLSHLGKILAGTWSATLLFISLSGVISANYLGGDLLPFVVLACLLVVPAAWWELLESRPSHSFGRGALAGAICGGGVQSLLVMGFALWAARQPRFAGGRTPEIDSAGIVALATLDMVAGFALGALLGLGIIGLRRLRDRLER